MKIVVLRKVWRWGLWGDHIESPSRQSLYVSARDAGCDLRTLVLIDIRCPFPGACEYTLNWNSHTLLFCHTDLILRCAQRNSSVYYKLLSWSPEPSKDRIGVSFKSVSVRLLKGPIEPGSERECLWNEMYTIRCCGIIGIELRFLLSLGDVDKRVWCTNNQNYFNIYSFPFSLEYKSFAEYIFVCQCA